MAEIGLRVAGFKFLLYPERLEFGYPDPEVMEKYFRPHERYLWVQRGYHKKLRRAMKRDPYLVLIGCSCTEWGRFDVELRERVRATPGAAPLRFANLACSGWSTYQGLQQMKEDVVALAPEVVTIFFGWNDHWVGFGVDDKTAAAMARGPGALQELRVVQLLTKLRVVLEAAAAGRKAGTERRPLRVSREDFRSNLEEMVDVARGHAIAPVLITAPTSHVEGEEPEYLRRRWIEDLSELVPLHQSYVRVVREVARDKDVVLCDLAAELDRLPREDLARLFKDDGIHFTPEGGVKVGEILHACLATHDLLPKARAAAADSRPGSAPSAGAQ